MARLRGAMIGLACLVAVAEVASGQQPGPEPSGPPNLGPEPAPAPAPPPPAAAPTPAKAAPVRAPERAAPERVAPVNPADVIESVRVEGNKRIEAGTIESYMLLRPGDAFSEGLMDRSLKALYATGLFSDVSLKRDGQNLVVQVTENPIVDRVAFEGNSEISDDDLAKETQLRARAVYTAAQAETDRQHLLDVYAHHGYFGASITPKVIRLADNRVNVVFNIKEGEHTLISRIAFVGNHVFSESALRDVITSRQEVWWNFLTSSDSYDPARVAYDKEQLRRFYLRNGYADFKVISANAELSPDRRSFFLTFTLSEGERYHVGSITIDSEIRSLEGKTLRDSVKIRSGDVYNGDLIESSIEAIKKDAMDRGLTFVDVKPEIKRNAAKKLIDLRFVVAHGPRIYVERIDITGNTRTQDRVVRRQFAFAEGDPLNQDQIKSTKQALQDLGYFGKVDITTSPGSAPDRSVVNAVVEDKATGQFQLGGGYSTDIGPLLNLGLTEKNILGSGNDAGITGVIALYETSVDLNFTNPYLFDRNLVSSSDLFYSNLNDYFIAAFNERRVGFSETVGYQISNHLRQSWSYQLAERQIYNVASYASSYIQNQNFISTLSQIGQVITLDYRDSATNPHTGFVTRLGTDYAGLGGNANFERFSLDGQYLIPLDRLTGNSDWGIAISGSGAYLAQSGQSYIVDRFFLGGYNLRGFLDGGVGPHDPFTGDSLGGNLMWTQSTELRFPLPVPPDLGVSGRVFADLGSLQGLQEVRGNPLYRNNGQLYANDGSIRVGAGFGITWNSPFGLINLDIADPIVKRNYDQTEIFRIGFGTRF